MVPKGLLKENEQGAHASTHMRRRYTSREKVGDRSQAVAMETILRAALSRKDGTLVEQKVAVAQGREPQGLSWAAQEAVLEVSRADLPGKKIVMLGAENACRTLLSGIGWKAAYRAGRSSGHALLGAHKLRSRAALLSCFLMMALAGVLWLAASGRASSPLKAVLLGTVALVSGGAWLLARRRIQRAISDQLVQALEDPGLTERAAAEIGRLLWPGLIGAQEFTIVIVDNYSRLPASVRAGAVAALDQGALDHAVTWVIFDADPPGLFLKDIARLRRGEVFGLSVIAYDLQPFSANERAEIAKGNGLSHQCAKSDDALFAALAGLPPRAGDFGRGKQGPPCAHGC
jgi:hypothetical protein